MRDSAVELWWFEVMELPSSFEVIGEMVERCSSEHNDCWGCPEEQVCLQYYDKLTGYYCLSRKGDIIKLKGQPITPTKGRGRRHDNN